MSAYVCEACVCLLANRECKDKYTIRLDLNKSILATYLCYGKYASL